LLGDEYGKKHGIQSPFLHPGQIDFSRIIPSANVEIPLQHVHRGITMGIDGQ